MIVEPVAVLDATSRQTDPRVTLFATDPASTAGFGEIRRAGGGAVTLGNLRAGEAYLNAEAAKELPARPGDLIRVFVAGRSAPFRVRAVVEYQGSGTDGLALLLPLTPAQRLLGHAARSSTCSSRTRAARPRARGTRTQSSAS